MDRWFWTEIPFSYCIIKRWRSNTKVYIRIGDFPIGGILRIYVDTENAVTKVWFAIYENHAHLVNPREFRVICETYNECITALSLITAPSTDVLLGETIDLPTFYYDLRWDLTDAELLYHLLRNQHPTTGYIKFLIEEREKEYERKTNRNILS